MLESIIKKLCNYLGDIYGLDYDDLQYSCGLSAYEVDIVKEIVESNDD